MSWNELTFPVNQDPVLNERHKQTNQAPSASPYSKTITHLSYQQLIGNHTSQQKAKKRKQIRL